MVMIAFRNFKQDAGHFIMDHGLADVENYY
jgi:hypothetical protein